MGSNNRRVKAVLVNWCSLRTFVVFPDVTIQIYYPEIKTACQGRGIANNSSGLTTPVVFSLLRTNFKIHPTVCKMLGIYFVVNVYLLDVKESWQAVFIFWE